MNARHIFHRISTTANGAAAFLDARATITNTSANGSKIGFFSGRKLVAMYDEVDGILRVYVDLSAPRYYGNLH